MWSEPTLPVGSGNNDKHFAVGSPGIRTWLRHNIGRFRDCCFEVKSAGVFARPLRNTNDKPAVWGHNPVQTFMNCCN